MDEPSVPKRGLSHDALQFGFRRALQLAASAFIDEAGYANVVG
jgi:hypothetical protein